MHSSLILSSLFTQNRHTCTSFGKLYSHRILSRTARWRTTLTAIFKYKQQTTLAHEHIKHNKQTKYMLNKLHKNALHKRSSGPKLITVEVSQQPFRLVHSFNRPHFSINHGRPHFSILKRIYGRPAVPPPAAFQILPYIQINRNWKHKTQDYQHFTSSHSATYGFRG